MGVMKKSKLTTSGIGKRAFSLFGGIYGPGPTAPLGSLKLGQKVDIDKFLALLNRRGPQGKPLSSQKWDDIPAMDYLHSPTTQEPTTQELLRGWVDEWLDSGRGRDGVEDPRERNFKKADGAALAAFKFSMHGKLLLLTDSNSLTPWISKYEGEPTGTLRPLGGPRNEDYAREQLVFFLLSELRFKLAKCRKEHCGTYFLLKHWNRQYKRGTLCDSCKRSRSLESAVKATEKVRGDAAGDLHKFAAMKYAKQISGTPDWHTQKALKNAIASFLNAKIERSESLRAVYKRGITGKWVARSENWNGIETALKGGK